MIEDHLNPKRVTEYRPLAAMLYESFKLITNPRNASEIVTASSGNYEIRLVRLFVLKEPEVRAGALGVLEAFDFDGVPIAGVNGPITIPYRFSDVDPSGKERPRSFHWRRGLEIPLSTKFFKHKDRLSLDEPAESNPIFLPVNWVEGVHARLAEAYTCTFGSLRGVIAIDRTGDGVEV